VTVASGANSRSKTIRIANAGAAARSQLIKLS